MKQCIALLILFSTLLQSTYATANTTANQATQKAVLVTGATRGIGAKITELLSTSGYFVYAGARKDEDMQRLDQMENVKAIRLDVTKPDQVKAAVETIEQAGRGLYGLVNNAGILIVSPLTEMDEKEFDKQIQVNLYGPWRITKAFAPLIKEQKGRIVTIGSKGGITCVPNFGAYHMSKFAMEGFTDTLALEMNAFDVKVSIVEPGNFSKHGGGDKMKVAKAVEHALFDPQPKRRYLVVNNDKSAMGTYWTAIHRLMQMNQDHPHSASLDKLSTMLTNQYKKMMSEQDSPAASSKSWSQQLKELIK